MPLVNRATGQLFPSAESKSDDEERKKSAAAQRGKNMSLVSIRDDSMNRETRRLPRRSFFFARRRRRTERIKTKTHSKTESSSPQRNSFVARPKSTPQCESLATNARTLRAVEGMRVTLRVTCVSFFLFLSVYVMCGF